MLIRGDRAKPFDFEGLSIVEYTAGLETSSSFAVITVPPGVRHREARSTRSDKYYFVAEGELEFILDGRLLHLRNQDFCIVPRGMRFSYRNRSTHLARLVLVHTPSFDLKAEEFLPS